MLFCSSWTITSNKRLKIYHTIINSKNFEDNATSVIDICIICVFWDATQATMFFVFSPYRLWLDWDCPLTIFMSMKSENSFEQHRTHATFLCYDDEPSKLWWNFRLVILFCFPLFVCVHVMFWLLRGLYTCLSAVDSTLLLLSFHFYC